MAISKLILNGDVQMDVTSDTVSANRMLNGYTATKNDGTKVTGNIATKSAADMTASGSTVTAAAGYYATATSKNVGAGSAFTPAVTITKNPTISLTSSTGAVTASYAGSSSVTPTVTAGYVAAGTAGTVSTSGTSTYQLTSKAAATYNTSTADQTIGSYQWLTGNQTIKSVTTSNLTAANIAEGVVVKVGDANNASRITQITGTHSGATSYTATLIGGNGNSSYCYVTYNNTKYYTNGNTFTYKAGDTLTIYCRGNNVSINGDGITLSSYSYTYTLPVGDITIDMDYRGSTSNYVDICGLVKPTGTYTVSADGDHNVYKYSVAYVPTGSAFPPSTTITTNPSFTLVSSTAKITAAYNGTSYVTPIVTSGWVAAGTSGVISTTGTSTFTLISQAAQTIYPSTADQTIASYRWLTGTQTIKSVTTTNLTAANIVSGTVVKVGDSGNASRITQVTGTFSGIIPTGTSNITSNGTYDVKAYASANVDVSATPNPGLYVTPNYDSGWYLSNSGVYVTDIPYVLEEEWEEKYETDVLMTSNSTSKSESTHECTATIILNNNISNGKGFICLLEVFYGEFQQDYIWLWSDNITIGTTQLNFQSMLDIATVKRASFTSANTLQIVFDWQNVYQGVNGIDDFFGTRFSSGVTINEPLDGYRGVVVQPPSGTEQFTENGSYDVKWDKTVSVNVPDPEYYNIYKTAFNTHYLRSNGSSYDGYTSEEISAFCNSLSVISQSMFAEVAFASSFTFSNVTSIGANGFACVGIPGGIHTTAREQFFFPALISIGLNGFFNRIGLKSIEAPNCKSIETSAFTGCTGLTTANFPSCTTINYAAFCSCDYLTTANFSACTIISDYAFSSCSRLSTTNFPVCTTVGKYAFNWCSSLTTVNFPSCETISYYAFANCSRLSTISFPVCTTISTGAFSYCSSLTTANFPSCTTIGYYAFNSCYGLTTISFPVCTTIGDAAFANCSQLISINFPACTIISGRAFVGCSSLTTISFPVCTTIGNNAFNYCSNLTTINFPLCETISSGAFVGCTGLTTANFSACTIISNYAFSGCNNLTTANFSSCEIIGGSAFNRCVKLVELHLEGVSSVPVLESAYAFYSTPLYNYSTSAGRWGSIFVPSSLYTAFQTAANWSNASIKARLVSV